jgi:hypothetical protein
MKALKVGMSVAITSMARTDAIGRILRITGVNCTVRLPNWQADGVHLDVHCYTNELETGHGRAEICECCFCR